MDADARASTSQQATASKMLVQITTDGIPKLHCPVCNKALVSLAGYVKHVKKHEPPGGFQCRYCDARFCHDAELKQHVDGAHKTLACRLCTDVIFSTAAEYRAHIQQQHNGLDRRLYVCDKCGVEYKSYEPYKRHSQTECGTQRPFKCDQCEMSFVTKYNLKHHQQTLHGGERRFCCSYCGKNFNQKGRLLVHERMHTGEKPYKCEVCGKCFAYRESIVTHSSVHTGIRLVECKCCATRFSCYSNLIKHRRTRPDTCGLPEYDPPKNRVRTRRQRIPGTAELKESSYNRIIRPGKAKQPRKKKHASSEEEELEASSSDDDVPLASRLKSQAPLKQESVAAAAASPSDDSSEEYPDFEPTNSDEDEEDDEATDAAQFALPAPALVKEELCDTDFEYQDASLFVQSTCDVKEEGINGDIYCSEKDKLLDVLLCTDADATSHGDSLKPFEILKVEHTPGILDEFAEVPLGGNNPADFCEEDVLALKEPTQPALNYASEEEEEEQALPKAQATTTARRKTRNRRSSSATPPSKTKIKTKITKKELKERLKMLNKVDRTWQCPHCVKIYHIRKPYEKHLRDDHKLPEEEIKNIFKDADAHAKLDEAVLKCRICGKIYLVEKRLETHMRVHGADGSLTFKCPCYCNLFFASKEEATSHAHAQHKELLYCEKCDKYMTGHDSLKNHEKNYHAKRQQQQQPRQQPRNLICDKCGKKFSGRTSLSDHVRSDCGRLPLYQCSVCDKRLSTAGILKTHMLLHQDETPYQCDKCGKTFKVKAQYKSHLKTRHTDHKPYKCHLCPKEYPYRESLLTHMTVHTGIKRFLCNNCGKRFTCISNLQAHRKVHADTCGQLPLNAKATQYMGVQRGKLLMGAKPEAGMEYEETKTLIAQDVIDRDMPMAQELNFPSEPSAPLATVPLNYASSHLVPHIVLQTMQAEAREAHI